MRFTGLMLEATLQSRQEAEFIQVTGLNRPIKIRRNFPAEAGQYIPGRFNALLHIEFTVSVPVHC